MHVVYLNYVYDPDLPDAHALLDRFYTTTHFCAAVRAAGVDQVSVVQRFAAGGEIERDGVTYHFVPDEFGHRLDEGQVPGKVHALAVDLCPDVVHHNGIVGPLAHLSPRLPRTTALLWQHHGGDPRRVPGPYEREGFGVLDGLIFTTAQQAEPWRAAGVIAPEQEIYELMEGSTWFRPLPREESRRRSGLLAGSPAFLWVGRLNGNKDPLTVLRGFARVARELPEAMLYMVYGTEELLPDVTELRRRLDLTERVHLLGRRPHEALPALYSAADCFVLGSHHEGSGYALLEALACGLTPVVTDIPSFRRITADGRLGRLWRPGSPEAFADAALAAAHQPPDRENVRRFFEDHWSFEVIGREAAALYRAAHERKRAAAAHRTPAVLP
ncbi:MAG TPA: glycosyltransferase family 4 protein [Longimicrobium sp.]|nr:glycosyltransferase family 4 protein [Longimicrobium sp.]